jgi:hypothetical protein
MRIMKRSAALVASGWLAAAWEVVPPQNRPSASAPNIILIQADDFKIEKYLADARTESARWPVK